ncbi:hypothetical protein K469DRAFT_634344 [Zopfia rhizophila CBS 207.26]|uniref:Uncharacterized protein n=1 Tax=Zopfia rhizophila CBS 207.26 TaxID=1314779 RepID=A0A6A6E0G8_9PEZI|nr:hypothetical protein K469DRAFT_634344 [Zopfia rhizophila CBS 207.26]
MTSLIFYPATWIKRMGLDHGLEARMVNSKYGWQFNLNPIRAVPENSPIFDLCRAGQTNAVELLISKGHGSVLDTSLKGWSPLHFAAAGGHVDLCASLIRLGADKTTLAYDGPSSNILSPIALFAALADDLPAETKIQMLRLFSDCLDLSSPDGDGWTVHAELMRTYNKEKVPISQNSITWRLRTSASENFIGLGPKMVWDAFQHAIRSFLVHESHNRIFDRLLCSHGGTKDIANSSHALAIARWLALRASQRKIMPMILDAGKCFGMKGFDWVEDDIPPEQFMKTLHVIYATWSIALPDNIDKLGELVRLELEICMEKLGWCWELLLDCISNQPLEIHRYSPAERICSACGDNYNYLGYGLVAPARIAFAECVKINHRLNCACSSLIHEIRALDHLSYCYRNGFVQKDDSDTDEEIFVAEEVVSTHSDIYSDYLKQLSETTSDPFLDAATMLYRAQGRPWVGGYGLDERLCATCFLMKEEYIGKNGLGTETGFPDMPESFEMFGGGRLESTVIGESN